MEDNDGPYPEGGSSEGVEARLHRTLTGYASNTHPVVYYSAYYSQCGWTSPSGRTRVHVYAHIHVHVHVHVHVVHAHVVLVRLLLDNYYK